MNYGLLIGGGESEASAAGSSTILDPSVGLAFAEVARATASDGDRAVVTAHEPFERGIWRHRSAP
jgi:acyl-CoA reductase-like NAD-dependent aldehyde dehydrogenase